jgi:hypothetical protein
MVVEGTAENGAINQLVPNFIQAMSGSKMTDRAQQFAEKVLWSSF